MLRALLVDDERLIRTMLRGLLNWESYGITLVGEAANGSEALAFLEEHPVDLLLTDLTMPGLSGFPFIKKVRERFPNLHIVVLTMHVDFGFVQEAMRLGVTDYIAKNQLKDQRFPLVLQSIVNRIKSAPSQTNPALSDTLLILYNPAEEQLKDTASFSVLAKDLYVVPAIPKQLPPHSVLLTVRNIQQDDFYQFNLTLRAYIQTVLFYQVTEKDTHYTIEYASIQPVKRHNSAETSDLLKTFEPLDWVAEDTVFREKINDILALHLSQKKAGVFFYQLYLLCNQHIPLDLASFFTNTGNIYWWYQWVTWLEGLRTKMYPFVVPQSSTKYIMQDVVNYLTLHYASPISLEDVLEKAAMSRSGFSHDFKAFTGKTFSEFLQDIRMNEAVFLLKNTLQPASEIAEQVGYSSQRSFRRAFFNSFGETPNVYRKKKEE